MSQSSVHSVSGLRMREFGYQELQKNGGWCTRRELVEGSVSMKRRNEGLKVSCLRKLKVR
jgi:hypothetical protein